MKGGDDMFIQVVTPTRIGNLLPICEGLYLVHHKLPHGTYELKKLNGRLIPRIRNSVNLRYYHS